MPSDTDDDDCMDNEKGLLDSLKDCISPDGESGVDERN